MGRFKYAFNVLLNRKTFRDLEEESPLRKLLSTIRSELGERLEEEIEDEEIGQGTSSEKKTFSGTLTHQGVKPGSLIIHAVVIGDTTETLSDNSDGTLTSPEGGSGTIDYVRGIYAITFHSAPKEGEGVFADYTGYYSTKEFVSDGLNPVYDACFIPYASGEDLDSWGETLELPRSPGEVDASYRSRLLAELRDFTASLTVKAFMDRVFEIISQHPSIIPLWALSPDWPLGWDEESSPWSTWVAWNNLADFLLVVPAGLNESQINSVAQAVSNIKFGPSRSLIVTGPVSGVYTLIKEVG